MCRYAFHGPYKSHHVCFVCRKGFKQPPIFDFMDVKGLGYLYRQLNLVRHHQQQLAERESEFGRRLADLEDDYGNAHRKCPECGELMIDMGMDFKTPRQSDSNSWRILQGMYRIGHAFQTCGCHGPGWIPSSSNDYRSYLARQRQHYEEALHSVPASGKLSPDERAHAINYWSSRLEAVTREQQAFPDRNPDARVRCKTDGH